MNLSNAFPDCPAESPAEERLERLNELLRGLGSAAIGFSGGVDSSFLLAAAVRIPGLRVVAYTAESASLPDGDRADAEALVSRLGVAHRRIRTQEMDNPGYVANAPDRCYHCKGTLFRALKHEAAREGLRHVLDGSNADDAGDYRPGRAAATELGVRSPLAEAGLTKRDIRELSRKWGLPTADKPAAACLSSRIPYGTPISPEALRRIDCAEQALRGLGFACVRVRAHGEVARIEVAPESIADATGPKRLPIVEAVRAAGFRYVSLDLTGYRTGSLNEGLGLPASEAPAGS
jgi:uncharacterized protein